MLVKRLATTPTVRVTAKPFTGPVPKMNSSRAANSCVTWLSTMVQNTRSKPASMAPGTLLPVASSSLMRSKMRILASTAMPRVRAKPAMPGSVSVALKEPSSPIITMTFTVRATIALRPDQW